ncbi:hypothetical protein RFI_19646, partial [Reticulomyxa filosa]
MWSQVPQVHHKRANRLWSVYHAIKVQSSPANCRHCKLRMKNCQRRWTQQFNPFPAESMKWKCLPKFWKHTNLKIARKKNLYTRVVHTKQSIDLISDGFWWFVIQEFHEQFKDKANTIFNRMSNSFVALFWSVPIEDKDF